jgi:hypothetical protein
VFVKRRVITVVVFGVFLCVQGTVRADQPPANDFAGQVMSDSKSGRVGIGTTTPAATLDVYRGEIKIGSTGTACAKALNGALRSENSKLQFCDGASWRNVSFDREK